MNTDTIDIDKLIPALKCEVLHKFNRTLDSTSDFDMLSVDIQRKTGDNISPSTLKRIFGYVKYDTIPRTSTLSVLARYAGYSGWSDFCERCPEANSPELTTRSHSKRRTGITAIIVTAIVLIAVLATGIYYVLNNMAETQNESVRPNQSFENQSSVIIDSTEYKYDGILQDCIAITKHKCDSIMAYKGTMPLRDYIEFSENAYFDIVFTQMKTVIEKRLVEAFHDEELVTVYSNEIFSQCRDAALVLLTQFSIEERRKAFAPAK